MKFGESKSVAIEIMRTQRGYTINFNNNHRSAGPLEEEPTFAEALALMESIEKLEG